MDLRSYVSVYPDPTRPGLLFYDLGELLGNKNAQRQVVKEFAKFATQVSANYVMAVDESCFKILFSLAEMLSAPRTTLKRVDTLLWSPTGKETYASFTGNRHALILPNNANLQKNSRVLIVDQALSTGATMDCAMRLCKSVGANVVGVATILEIMAGDGRKALGETPFYPLMQY